MYACIRYKLDGVGLTMHMRIWVSIPNQGSMKYAIYSYIEHGNVIEQQMSGIHVQNQIGYTSTVMTLNSQCRYTLYIFCRL